jgi:RNA polymerase sigma-70 factor (ECF subfamily)
LIEVPQCTMASFTVPVVSKEEGGPMADPVNAIARQPAGALLAEHLPVLRAIARGLCRDRSKAEDLVQDTFERALRALHQLDQEKNPRSWMVTILHNLHIDRCRELARLQPHVPCDEVPLRAPDGADAPPWSTLTAEDVARAIRELPSELRTTYCLFTLEGKSYVEIAKRLDISKITVGTRILRARAHLKKMLIARLGEGAP